MINFYIFSVRATIDRYKKATIDSSNTMSTSEANTQAIRHFNGLKKFYQQEATKLRRQIREIQNSNRQLLGEGVSNMPLKELRNMEGKVEKAISRIRTKKNEMLFAEIELMQKRELELHNANMYLRAKIGESERAQQQMNMMNQEYEQPSMSSHNYDVRNFLPVNLLQPEHDRHYSCQDQTPLQLV
ncbi:hypothetical protein SASPL_117267 [Salvia splendens]|uniref:K-box domain-containing protein n=1 Tax=Salvia splendens TaxID=180675 RepID=A0A8X8XXK5_SALSN|nr:hypothetical protein SASPL_117267 [Salvia splendens]